LALHPAASPALPCSPGRQWAPKKVPVILSSKSCPSLRSVLSTVSSAWCSLWKPSCVTLCHFWHSAYHCMLCLAYSSAHLLIYFPQESTVQVTTAVHHCIPKALNRAKHTTGFLSCGWSVSHTALPSHSLKPF
jgi:uncharacterized protein YjlB